MPSIKKIASIHPHYCVTCGYCTAVCPVHAISILKGIRAEVDAKKCIGCAKCTRVCPIQIITMITTDQSIESPQ